MPIYYSSENHVFGSSGSSISIQTDGQIMLGGDLVQHITTVYGVYAFTVTDGSHAVDMTLSGNECIVGYNLPISSSAGYVYTQYHIPDVISATGEDLSMSVMLTGDGLSSSTGAYIDLIVDYQVAEIDNNYSTTDSVTATDIYITTNPAYIEGYIPAIPAINNAVYKFRIKRKESATNRYSGDILLTGVKYSHIKQNIDHFYKST